MFSPNDLRIWLAIVLSGIALATTIWGVLQARSRDNSGKIENLSERVVKVEGSIKGVEREMAHLPKKEAVHQIELAISDLRGELSSQTKEVSSVLRTINRIETHLLESKT
ncbi:MAG: DUF2730 family protein [Cohaesibacteraceae bacterium]|nr:DUF2730 family protein [Cohaesibacteraceae bacterium]MBL4877052.1 DUF2730 family protein [Cohaesibacteraceae bacterium]